MYELNNLIEILTIQYTVTCKSVYTKGYDLN